MYQLVTVLTEQFKGVFPEIVAQQEYITNVIHAEEKSFLKTLGQGISIFEDMIQGSASYQEKMLLSYMILMVSRLI